MWKSRGFTLIELLVVIAIIGLLSSIVLASLNTARARSRDASRLEELHALQSALELYYTDNGHYPPSCGGSTWGGESPSFGTCTTNYIVGLVPKYISALPRDPSIGSGYGYLYGSFDCTSASAVCAFNSTGGHDYKLMDFRSMEGSYGRCPSTCSTATFSWCGAPAEKSTAYVSSDNAICM